jgi:hypothetical protein
VTIPLTVNRLLNGSRFVELKIQVASTSGDHAMFAYDTVAFPAKLVLPVSAT